MTKLLSVLAILAVSALSFADEMADKKPAADATATAPAATTDKPAN